MYKPFPLNGEIRLQLLTINTFTILANTRIHSINKNDYVIFVNKKNFHWPAY